MCGPAGDVRDVPGDVRDVRARTGGDLELGVGWNSCCYSFSSSFGLL